MYSFFVADEPPVPQWPYTPPRDPEAIEALSEAYFESGYDIGAMLRVLFSSHFFKSADSRYQTVKSPAELVAGVLRLTGEFRGPHPKLQNAATDLSAMGQTLNNPPSVEGWQGGVEWIDTGNLVERINFASNRFGDAGKPGIREMTARIVVDSGGFASPESLVRGCLDQMGAVDVSEATQAVLTDHASRLGEDEPEEDTPDRRLERRAAEMLRVVAATPEFQLG